MDKPFVLELTASGKPQRYQLRTTTAVQVGQMQFANELLYVLEYTILHKNKEGYVVQIEVLNAMQKATDLFSQVTADLNKASRKLVLQTDAHGQLLRVENQAEIWRAWEVLRPTLEAKYSADLAVKPYLEAFGQQLAVPGSMEDNLRDKGVCGALMLSVYGQSYHETPLVSKQKIKGFFHEIDLPLQLATTATTAPEPLLAPAIVLLNVTAQLDSVAFANDDFRRLMRSIADDYTLPVTLQLDYTAHHALAADTGHLLRSQQRLAVEVPGVYHNTVMHEVFPQPVA